MNQQFNFTGQELAEAHLLHLTVDEKDAYIESGKYKSRTISDNSLAVLWRRLRPRKIFLIRFKEEKGFKERGGMIIMADNERDACIQAVPFLLGPGHHCKNPSFNKTCPECRQIFDTLATKLSNSYVIWLGWGQPKYNWAIHM